MGTIRVGVIMGGRGNEKEVSFNSGRTVCDHLDTFRYTIIPIFQCVNGLLYILPWRFLHRGKTSDFEHRLESEAERISWDSLKERIDFMYIAVHGRFAEDGTLQGFLEVLGIPYLGSKVFAAAVSMDKAMQKEMLHSEGILVPKGIVVKPHEIPGYLKEPQRLYERLDKAGLEAPYFARPSSEGSSLGISMIFEGEALVPGLATAAYVDGQRPQAVLLEEYVVGMEFTCVTITDYKTGEFISLPPTEVVPEKHTYFFDYEQKYMPGRALKFTPARCSESMIKKVQETCMRVTQVLGMKNISRIDGFVTEKGDVIITDPNILSGMAPASFLFRQAAEINMSHTAFINHLIKTELVQYGMLDAVHNPNNQERQQMDQQKKRIGILLSGRSHEKEISLESGRNVYYKLSPYKYEPIALFVDDNLELYRLDQSLLVHNSTKEIALDLQPSMKVAWNDLPELVDFVFIGLHGGEGENGCVQGTLEMLNIPYNGSSVLASALCMDKFKSANFLKSKGFEVPKNYLIDKGNWLKNRREELAHITQAMTEKETVQNMKAGGQEIKSADLHNSVALVVKPHDDGCSTLVYKVDNEKELIEAVDSIFADDKNYALVEEYIKGMELTVGVLGNAYAHALLPSQAIATREILSIEEKFLPGAGENQTPAPLPQETLTLVRKTVEAAYLALNCKGYSRIDCFYQRAEESPTGMERVVILECNTLPGLTPATCIFHQAAEIGLKPMEFIDLIVELGFEEHGIRPRAVENSVYKKIMNAPTQEKL